jgi:hypothetical protein
MKRDHAAFMQVHALVRLCRRFCVTILVITKESPGTRSRCV